MTVITTSTAATATAYSNQRKIDRTSNGVLWMGFTAGLAYAAGLRYSVDEGATWNDGGAVSNGSGSTSTTYTRNFSFFIDADDYAHVVFKDNGDGYIYYRRGTPNTGRTAWTWSAATTVWNLSTTADYPDVVAHREGTGWKVHTVASYAHSTTANGVLSAQLGVTSGGSVSVDQSMGYLSEKYDNTVHKYPSIDFNHTGDGKTVAGGTPHLYVAWSAGATGSGKGIRFKKATYSGGTWTWGTEREIDSTRYVASIAQWVTCMFDGTRVIIPGLIQESDAYFDTVLYDRDAGDTSTSSRVLLNGSPSSPVDAFLYGSASYDGNGNVFILGRPGGPAPQPVHYRKWSRSTAALDGSSTTVDLGSSAPHVSAKRGYSGNRIEFVYTDGTASPYSVTYGAVTLNVGATVGVTDETDSALGLARQKTRTVSPSLETDAAQPVGKIKQVALGTAVETDVAVTITRRPRVFLAVGTATETDTAEPITQRPQTIVAVGTAAEADAARPLVGALVPVYYRFTPPTAIEKIRTDRLFSRYGVPVGQTVIKIDGVYTVTPYPWLGDLQGLKDGVDYFLGGRDYTVPSSVAADLTAAGYELQRVS